MTERTNYRTGKGISKKTADSTLSGASNQRSGSHSVKHISKNKRAGSAIMRGQFPAYRIDTNSIQQKEGFVNNEG